MKLRILEEVLKAGCLVTRDFEGFVALCKTVNERQLQADERSQDSEKK